MLLEILLSNFCNFSSHWHAEIVKILSLSPFGTTVKVALKKLNSIWIVLSWAKKYRIGL